MGPIKESESQSPDLELRSPDPQTADSLKAVNGSDAERSPDVVAEGEALGSPQPLGNNLALRIWDLILHEFLGLGFGCVEVLGLILNFGSQARLQFVRV